MSTQETVKAAHPPTSRELVSVWANLTKILRNAQTVAMLVYGCAWFTIASRPRRGAIFARRHFVGCHAFEDVARGKQRVSSAHTLNAVAQFSMDRDWDIVHWMREQLARGVQLRVLGTAVFNFFKYGDQLSVNPVQRGENRVAFPVGPLSIRDTIFCVGDPQKTAARVCELADRGDVFCEWDGCVYLAPSARMRWCFSCYDYYCPAHQREQPCTNKVCPWNVCDKCTRQKRLLRAMYMRCPCGASCCLEPFHSIGWELVVEKEVATMRCPVCVAAIDPLPAFSQLGV